MCVITGMLQIGDEVLRLEFCKVYKCCIDKGVRLVLGSDENAIGLIALHACFEPNRSPGNS